MQSGEHKQTKKQTSKQMNDIKHKETSTTTLLVDMNEKYARFLMKTPIHSGVN